MAEVPGTGFIKWPTDAEVRANFDAYVTAVGRIANAWSYLHKSLGALFPGSTSDQTVSVSHSGTRR
jgi:hypothetical protein